MPSKAQIERQSKRNRRGQYKEYTPCEVCGKPLSEDKFFSDIRDWPADARGKYGPPGLVLCEKCGGKGESMPLEDALKFYQSTIE